VKKKKKNRFPTTAFQSDETRSVSKQGQEKMEEKDTVANFDGKRAKLDRRGRRIGLGGRCRKRGRIKRYGNVGERKL
jgi:hypothetical protein